VSRPRLAARAIAAVAACDFVVLVAGAGGYGYGRDELYFIQAGEHPAFGYDDQPPLTPLIGRASTALFGQTPTGLRVASALAIAACVVLAGLVARELGGGPRAQVLASASLAASSVMYLGHILSTSTFDFLAWTVLLYLIVRLLRGADPRLWLAVGGAAGLALENKWLVLLLFAALAVGIPLARRFDLLRSPWVWLGAALALAIWLPNLLWQADHGWPQRELSDQIAGEDPLGARIAFLPFQLLIVSPLLAPVWIGGLLWLLRDERARPYRALGLGYLALVAICLLTAGKVYYAVGWYPTLLAAGGVALEPWLESLRARLVAGTAVALAAAVSAVIALPVVPERSLADTPVGDLNDDVLETVGWPRFVDRVASVAPPNVVIFTANYGEAGAIRRYGPTRGLPTAYSGHNSFWSFGRPPGSAGPILAVGFDSLAYLARFFTGCRVVARYDNGLRIDNEEQGARLWLCEGPRRPWAVLWPRLHHLDA
jgi:hypothetical protein